MLIKTDRIYWRIVPVGFATVFLSSVMLLAYLQLLQQFRGWGGNVSVPALIRDWLLMSGMVALFVGFIAWLPLQILWNVLVNRLWPRLGLQRATFRVSFGMATVLCLPLAMLTWRGAEWSPFPWRPVALSLLWVIGTGSVAAWLTHFAFRLAPNRFVGGEAQP